MGDDYQIEGMHIRGRIGSGDLLYAGLVKEWPHTKMSQQSQHKIFREVGPGIIVKTMLHIYALVQSQIRAKS